MGEQLKIAPPDPQGPVRLAGCGDFRLGRQWVRPSLRQLGDHILEPRAMQVLVALHQAAGGVVSRDLLIARCWNGRIVGDNAINRVIAILRKLARDTAAFEIDTVARVGYRLRAAAGAAPPEPALPAATPPPLEARRADKVVTRRAAALGGATALLAGAAVWRLGGAAPSRARALIDQAEAAMRDERFGVVDPEALLAEALQLAPSDARGWGLLALAISDRVNATAGAERTAASAQCQQAIARALAIDPNQPDARLAKVRLNPLFMNWLPYEADLQAILNDRPQHVPTLAILATLFAETGRIAASARLRIRLGARYPVSPELTSDAIWGLAMTGQRTAMIALADRAVARWPGMALVGRAIAYSYLQAGFIADLERLVRTRADILPDDPPGMADAIEATMAALRGRGPVAAAVAACRAAAARRQTAAILTIPMLGSLGARDDAFAHADSYFLGRGPVRLPNLFGRTQPVAGERSERLVRPLFVPLAVPLHGDARFLALCGEIGLDAYWQAARVTPDFLARPARRPQ